MIDTYHLAVIPVLLGNGIRLFGTTDRKIKLEMVGTKEYNGIIEMYIVAGIFEPYCFTDIL